MKHCGLLFFLLLGVMGLTAATVVDASTLPANLLQNARPDVMGKVLLVGTPSTLSTLPVDSRHAEAWDGFPVAMTGGSTEGGVFVNLDDNPALELVHGFNASVHVFNIDGTEMTGWPQTMTYPISGSPAIGDIDGDGQVEVVASTHNLGTQNHGILYAFHKDGSAVTGFPVTLPGGATNTVTVADINGDGIDEILLSARSYPNGYLCAYDGTGTPVTGFPATLDYVPASPVAVGDITGDGVPELVLESYYSVYAYDNQGVVVTGFPFTPGNGRTFSYSTPVLADLDNDGYREIVCGDHNTDVGDGKVHVLKHDGSEMTGWPKSTGSWVYTPPSVGDIDGDGGLEVCAGDQAMTSDPANSVYAWHADGSSVSGFPITPVWALNAQIMLVDVDNDGLPELITDDNTGDGLYPAYNGDGSDVTDWDVSVSGSSFYQTPSFADVDGDGQLDMTGGGYDLNNGNTQLYLWKLNTPVNATGNILTVNQYNVGHTGLYVAPSVPPEDHHYGDVNDDGVADTTDVQIILDYAVNLDPLSADPRPWEDWRLARADLDGNGQIQAFDASLLLQYLAGSITEYPVEQEGYVPPVGQLTLTYGESEEMIHLTGADSLYAFQIRTSSLVYPGSAAMLSFDDFPENIPYSSFHMTDTLFCAAASPVPLQGNCGEFRNVIGDRIRDYAPHTFHLTMNDVESDVSLDLYYEVANNDPVANYVTIALPNPYRPGMTMQFSIPRDGANVQAALYNTRGQKVRTLLQGKTTAGLHVLTWDGKTDSGQRAASGVYFMRLENGKQVVSRKMVLLR